MPESLCSTFDHTTSEGTTSVVYTVSTSDTASLTWSFSTDDDINFPEGDYRLKFTLSIGGTDANVFVNLELTGPCDTATVSFNPSANAFAAGPFY